MIEITGSDATDFLQGVITNDIAGADAGQAIYAGLLTPQGKLLFDFFLIKHEKAYLLDVDASVVGEFIKRLMFYKLRADVEIALLCRAFVCVNWNGDDKAGQDCLVYDDPRLKEMGQRFIWLEGNADDFEANREKWLEHRIANAIPEAPHDYEYGNCFPHDIAMDQLNGIGFKKGCYVGQEVVSRMEHRGTARKRPMIVHSNGDLPTAPAKIEVDGKPVGTLGSGSGKTGLGEIRLDRAAKAVEAGNAFTIGGMEVEIIRPKWATYGEEFDNGG